MDSTYENLVDIYNLNTQQDQDCDYEATQLQHESGTKSRPSCEGNETSSGSKSINIWGQLRWRKINDDDKFVEDIRDLYHRVKDGHKDTFSVGRSKKADFIVDDDKKISAVHCIIYCDYTQARLRFFVEDCSANGTFVNDSLTRLKRGERMELKSGYEIFLKNPRNADPIALSRFTFTFINIRERMLAQSELGTANSAVITENVSHIEEKYIIGDQIGSGMSGQVYKCINRETKCQCAVKIIDTKKFALTPGLTIKELKEEAQMMNQLDHPNIVKILETFQTDSILFIVMELVQGGDLFDRIVERGRYSEENARLVMGKVLAATQYLHSRSIIHRDLKPENILLVSPTSDVDVKITDFGLAKKTNQDGLKTFCGTPQYFAPEVLKRKESKGKRGRYYASADMWSLGVVLYILLSGTFPFDEDHLFEQIEHAHYSFSGPEWGSISPGAKNLVSSLLTLRPDLRLTVHQALKHPWITGRDHDSPMLPLPGQGHRMMSPDMTVRATGSGTKNSSNKKRKDSAIAPAHASASKTTTPKPHIGTVPLFLVKKQPTVLRSGGGGGGGASEPHSAFPAAPCPSSDHHVTTPCIGATPFYHHPFDGGAPTFGVHGAPADGPTNGVETPAADDGGRDCVVEDIDMFSSDEEEERDRRAMGAGGSNPNPQNLGKRRSKETTATAIGGRKRTAPSRSKLAIDVPSIPAQSDQSTAASSHHSRDGASPGPGPVSLFQMMKLSSIKWTKTALPGSQEPTPMASDVAASAEMVEGCEEAAAGGMDMAAVPPGIAPITQYFKRQDAPGKLSDEAGGDSSKRSLESSSTHHQVNAHSVHANKRQKSLIEVWNIRTETSSPKKRDHQEDAENKPLQKLASPSSSDIVCSPLTLSSGEKKKNSSSSSSSSSKRGVAASRRGTTAVGFHTEEFGHLKKLRKPKKSLSAVFKL